MWKTYAGTEPLTPAPHHLRPSSAKPDNIAHAPTAAFGLRPMPFLGVLQWALPRRIAVDALADGSRCSWSMAPHEWAFSPRRFSNVAMVGALLHR